MEKTSRKKTYFVHLGGWKLRKKNISRKEVYMDAENSLGAGRMYGRTFKYVCVCLKAYTRERSHANRSINRSKEAQRLRQIPKIKAINSSLFWCKIACDAIYTQITHAREHAYIHTWIIIRYKEYKELDPMHGIPSSKTRNKLGLVDNKNSRN